MTTSRQLKHSDSENVSVVGLVPRKVLEKWSTKTKPSYGGGIDTASGLAFALFPCGHNATESFSAVRLNIWRQETCTLTEDLVAGNLSDEKSVGDFIHPDYIEPTTASTSQMPLIKHEELVTFVPTSVWSQTSSMSLYWCSPKGMIHMWIDISGSGYTGESDIVTQVPLNEDEYVTHTRFCDGNESIGNAAGMLLIGTSQKRTFQCVKITRPLALRVQLLLSEDQIGMNDGSSDSQGLLSNMYSYFTPSKKKAASMGFDAKKITSDPIIGAFPHYVSQRINPQPINKRLKLETLSNGCLFTISRSGVITQWMLNRGESLPIGRYMRSLDICESMRNKTDMDDSLSMRSLLEVEVLSANLDIASSATSIVACVKACLRDETDSANIGKIYLLSFPIDSENDFSFDIGTGIWLSRYNSKAILSKDLICDGMVVRSETSGRNNFTTVFCAFHDTKQKSPVVISVARICQGSTQTNHVQCYDVDLPRKAVPSILQGTISKDATTDGCLFISRAGLLVNARVTFPTLLTSETEGESSEVVQNEQTLHILKNHILSAFNNTGYYQKSRTSANGAFSPIGKNIDALPQSIQVADDTTLSLAVCLAANHQANDNTDREGTKYNIISSSKVIETKMRTHQAFINFLIRAGIYRRIRPKARVALRDVGEKMYAIHKLMEEWKSYIKATAQEDIAIARNLINDILVGIEEDVVSFQTVFSSLCDHVFHSEGLKVSPLSTPWALNTICHMTCLALENAFNYRKEKSEVLYDIQFDCDDSKFYPWTSSSEVLDGLHQILKEVADSRFDEFDQHLKQDMHHMIIYMSKRLLDGYHDAPSESYDASKYDRSKRICIPLLREFQSSNSSQNQRDEAYELSIKHAFFHGVVDICHANAKYGQFSHPTYDLGHIMRHKELDDSNIYRGLYTAKDFTTGLEFAEFVFHWFTNKNMFGTVLELGKISPQELSTYMLKDERLSHLAWIQDVETNNFENASKNLLKLYSDGMTLLTENDVSYDNSSMHDQELLLTFAKLAACASDTPDDSITNVIDDHLEKIHCCAK